MNRFFLQRLVFALVLVSSSCGETDDALESDADRDRDAQDRGLPTDAGQSVDADQRDSATADSDIGEEDGDATKDAGLPMGCRSEACDLLVADSCDEQHACQFLLPNDDSIAPVAQCQPAGELAESASCSSTFECGPGLDCTVDCDPDSLDCEADENRGFCRSYCCALNRTSRCPQEQACLIELTDAEGGSTGVGLCDFCDDCNPLFAEDCVSGQGCYLLPDDEHGGVSLCYLCMESDSGLSQGARCNSANDCSPGLGCFSIDGQPNMCTRFCDLTSGIDVCQPEGSCQDNLGEASREGTLGICIPFI